VYICDKCGKEWNNKEASDNEFCCVKKCGGALKERAEGIPKKTLFISYGRDKYAFVADRLKNDLTAMGYPVWFDLNK
jgi:hypothetical protein